MVRLLTKNQLPLMPGIVYFNKDVIYKLSKTKLSLGLKCSTQSHVRTKHTILEFKEGL